MTRLESYLKDPRVQKTLRSKPGDEGFSLVELVVVIAVLAILTAVAVPAFVGVQANAQASAVKNGIINGIKECIVRDADDALTTTTFGDVQSFKASYSGYDDNATTSLTFYSQTLGCFGAIATPDDASNMASFTATLNKNTGVMTKTCATTGKPGCPTSGNW